MIILLKSGTKNNPDFFTENQIKTNTKLHTLENKIIIPFIFEFTAGSCANA